MDNWNFEVETYDLHICSHANATEERKLWPKDWGYIIEQSQNMVEAGYYYSNVMFITFY